MLTFEEFFKKKKIDLAALQQGDPALFSEFVAHYDHMGEKSFDHTKKYWFNRLRKDYHLAPEIKAEPLRNENRLAEQTITDSLSAPAENAPKQGFTPRFKANVTKQPEPAAPVEDAEASKPAEPAPVKPGFTPRFKANAAKPAEPTAPAKENADKPADTSKKPGFTPRFKAGVTKPGEEAPSAENISEKPAPENAAAESAAGKPAAEAPKKPGFTPRFKAGVTKPAAPPAENIPDKPVDENVAAESAADKPVAEAPKKPGFTPRFKAGVTKPAAPEEQAPETPAVSPLSPESKSDTPLLQEANVPEFDFTGRFVPKSPVGELKPILGKMDKLTEQADRLAADFKSRFKATHLPKNAARLNPGEPVNEKSTPESAKNKEVDAEKIAYKPRFNAKKMPPKSSE